MTELLDQAIESALPSDQQGELARLALRLTDARPEPVALSQASAPPLLVPGPQRLGEN